MVALPSVTNLLKLADEYAILRAAFWNNKDDMKDLLDAIPQASSAAWRRDEARANEIKAMLDSPDVSDGAKRLYERELEQLRSKTYGADAEDEADFNELMEAMTEQEVALRRLREKIKGAIRDVEKDVEDIRGKTCGDSCAIVYQNWLEGYKKDFRNKCQNFKAPGTF